MRIFGSQQSSASSSHNEIRKLVTRKIKLEASPFEVFANIQEKVDHCFILDSVVGPDKLAEYSFIGFEPESWLKVQGHTLSLEHREGGREQIAVKDPLNEIRRIVGSTKIRDGMSRFSGGAVGYISYDAIRYWEEIPDKAGGHREYPDIEMALYGDGLVFDHRRNETYYFHTNEDRMDQIIELSKGEHHHDRVTYTEPKANTSQDRYEESVLKAKEYIASGDIFQVVLSKRLGFKVEGDLSTFYRQLKAVNPSPYMYSLKMGKRMIIGSSPEMLVRVENRRIETFPIAGTRPRVEDHAENSRLRAELLRDPKDRAEHVMLVDLARNDVGRISNYGSVGVPEFMTVHEYSHVQHIVSQVVGELAEPHDSYDTLRAVFPAGTVSGAPKVRAMEIIDELETSKRGPYAGALGYFSFNGNSDFAITIRTLTANGSDASIQVGAGIVADSVPEREWYETEQKAGGLLKALEKASGEVD